MQESGSLFSSTSLVRATIKHLKSLFLILFEMIASIECFRAVCPFKDVGVSSSGHVKTLMDSVAVLKNGQLSTTEYSPTKWSSSSKVGIYCVRVSPKPVPLKVLIAIRTVLRLVI